MIAQLIESFDRPVKWIWTTRVPYMMEAQFEIPDINGPIPYYVKFDRFELSQEMRNIWHVEFGYRTSTHSDDLSDEDPTADDDVSRYRLGGTGHEMQVLSTVIDVIKNFLRVIRPQRLTFYGKKDSESRQKIYQRLLQRAVQQFPDYTASSFRPVTAKFAEPGSESSQIKTFQLTRIRG